MKYDFLLMKTTFSGHYSPGNVRVVVKSPARSWSLMNWSVIEKCCKRFWVSRVLKYTSWIWAIDDWYCCYLTGGTDRKDCKTTAVFSSVIFWTSQSARAKSGINWFVVKDVIFQLVTQAYSGKNFRVLPTGVEPMTLRLVLRMLYHWAIGDSWSIKLGSCDKHPAYW